MLRIKWLARLQVGFFSNGEEVDFTGYGQVTVLRMLDKSWSWKVTQEHLKTMSA